MNQLKTVLKNEGSITDHSILSFFNSIDKLKAGKYEWDNKEKKWICTTCN